MSSSTTLHSHEARLANSIALGIAAAAMLAGGSAANAQTPAGNDAPAVAATQPAPRNAADTQVLFTGSLALDQGVAAAASRIEIRRWGVPERQRVGGLRLENFTPGRTLTIYQLRGGDVTTLIGGQRVVRHTGDFWTVLPGQSLVLETGDDNALIETITIEQ
jgi:hypothetical protein